MRWFARTPARRDFPERIEIVDLAPPEAPLSEFAIVPEIEEGKIAAPTATYRWERKRISRRQRFAQAIFVVAVVGAHLLGFIR